MAFRNKIYPTTSAMLLSAISVTLPRVRPFESVSHPQGPLSSDIFDCNVLLMIALMVVFAAMLTVIWPSKLKRWGAIIAWGPVGWSLYISLFRGQGDLLPLALVIALIFGGVVAFAGAGAGRLLAGMRGSTS